MNTWYRRRQWALHLGAAACLAAWPLGRRANAEHSPPIRLLVGFAAGGVSDLLARVLGRYLERRLGQTVVVDNRVGAGGVVAARLLKASPPDGRTLMLSHAHTISIVPALVKDAGYRPEQDFIGLGGVANVADCLAVSASAPVQSFADWLAWARHHPNGGHVGVSALGSVQEMLVRVLAKRHRLPLMPVPYTGSAPIVNDLLGGQIGAGMASVPDLEHHHHAGRVRVLAVFGQERHPHVPDVPTFSELGSPELARKQYFGVYAPAGIDAAQLARLTDALAQTVASHELVHALANMGLGAGYMTPEELTRHQVAYRTHWMGIWQRVSAPDASI